MPLLASMLAYSPGESLGHRARSSRPCERRGQTGPACRFFFVFASLRKRQARRGRVFVVQFPFFFFASEAADLAFTGAVVRCGNRLGQYATAARGGERVARRITAAGGGGRREHGTGLVAVAFAPLRATRPRDRRST